MMLEAMKLKKYNSQDNNMIECGIPKELKHVIDAIRIQEEKTPEILDK